MIVSGLQDQPGTLVTRGVGVMKHKEWKACCKKRSCNVVQVFHVHAIHWHVVNWNVTTDSRDFDRHIGIRVPNLQPGITTISPGNSMQNKY